MTPIELDPIPDPVCPDGGKVGAFDASGNIYEAQELLHRPHAFALMHGKNGAKVAYGELHYLVNSFQLKFETSSISVADHDDHSHAPHCDHTHDPHTGSTSTDSGSSSSYGTTTSIDDATTGTDNGSHSGYGTTTSIDDATTGGADASFSGFGETQTQSTTTTTGGPTTPATDSTNPERTGLDLGTTSGYVETTHFHNHDHTHDITHGHEVEVRQTHEHPHTHDVQMGHTHEHDHTHGVDMGHTHTFNLSHSGAKDVGGSGPSDCVLKHTGVKGISDGFGTDSTAADGVLEHTVSGQITYCSGASQESIGNIVQKVPRVKTEDGELMDSTINEEYYHELEEYGDVYLCWKVDLEQVGKEVTKCWVQIGEPDGDPIINLGMGTSTTNRRLETGPHEATGQPEGEESGVYRIKLGNVPQGNKIEQYVSSDVVWQPTVLDRALI